MSVCCRVDVDSFVVLVSGFAFLANFLFGYLLPDFHNFTASFSTLLRFPLGDFDYNALQTVRRCSIRRVVCDGWRPYRSATPLCLRG